ncbi:hypothetical protein CCAX7_64300 [Capsulimonas corticalis]|uniref:Intracellular proteinase inhibitor BsuPI domain-containing protein n=1 Tax=Capsulimonas corticalis TaxID=2219043 RepID=A0A402CQU0_9BACT|nr:BsuPI-related putative proteinase inhibitor [Capsulimonas corticalis]BDI34379.1 hypothetical protein CCAX7_64300 [Capsulimonas corticalis]
MKLPIYTLPLALIALAPIQVYADGAPTAGAGATTGVGPEGGAGAVLPLPGATLKATTIGDTATVATPKLRFASGAAVPIVFTIANHTGSPVEYDFNNGQKYDFELRDAKGQPIWEWSRGLSFTQSTDKLVLKAGESTTFKGEWNGQIGGKPAPPGKYILTARLTTQTRPAIRGGILVNPVQDPDNMGIPTRSPAENGMVVQTPARYAVTATTQFWVVGKS